MSGLPNPSPSHPSGMPHLMVQFDCKCIVALRYIGTRVSGAAVQLVGALGGLFAIYGRLRATDIIA